MKSDASRSGTRATITVLVATYNRANLLDRCLKRLASQQFDECDEVVVVDNGSTDDTPEVVRRAAATLPVPVRYILEPRPGKSQALTTGVAASNGDVLALTDDDVLVGDRWLEVIRELWRNGGPGVAGGRVLPDWERQPPRWLRVDRADGFGLLSAPLALLDYGSTAAPLGPRTALGANMAVGRNALRSSGGFPLDLGKRRGTLLSGEDHAICERVQAAGFEAVYEPRMVVLHHVPADRLTFSYHVRWFFWSGITNAALDRRNGKKVRLRYWIGRIVRDVALLATTLPLLRFARAAEASVDITLALGYLAFSRGWVRTGEAATSKHNHRAEAA